MAKPGILIVAALLLAGCHGEPSPPGAPTGSRPAAAAPQPAARAAGTLCSALAEADCQAAPSCELLWAWLPEDACAGVGGERLFAGCHPADTGCGEAETCAAHGVSGELLVFPTTCLPDGWSPADTCCPP